MTSNYKYGSSEEIWADVTAKQKKWCVIIMVILSFLFGMNVMGEIKDIKIQDLKEQTKIIHRQHYKEIQCYKNGGHWWGLEDRCLPLVNKCK